VTGPPVVAVDDPDDARVAAYVGLRDADLRARVESAEGVFVVEGLLTLEQLMRSPYPLRSSLVAPGKLDAVLALLRTHGADESPVYVAGPAVLDRVVGFPLHRGVVALAGRLALPPMTALLDGARRIAVLEQTNDHENLGGLFRNAAAFGLDAVLLDPRSADPLYRRSVRVSLGHVLRVPFTRAEPWPDALDEVKAGGFTLLALTPARDARPIDELVDPLAGARLAFLLGAEGPGLSDAALAAADLRVRIPIAPGVDSLNVATAAAIAFYRVRDVR
jgi:tRNA G18 (ribose-2'-O)-methylase SpoU